MKILPTIHSQKKLALLLMFMLSFFAFSQEIKSTDYQPDNTNLPTGYSTVKLGMSLEDVKTALLRDPDFGYRGERDVSLLPGENRHLIETRGADFLGNCWFQFHENALYIISINVNPDFMDYYSIFSTLCKKYGNPNYLDPEKATWEDESVILSLEKPLCLKYTDAQTYQKLTKNQKFKKQLLNIYDKDF